MDTMCWRCNHLYPIEYISCPECYATNPNYDLRKAQLEEMGIPESEDYSHHLIEARRILAEIEDFASKRNYFMAKMACHTLAKTEVSLWESLNKLYNEAE